MAVRDLLSNHTVILLGLALDVPDNAGAVTGLPAVDLSSGTTALINAMFIKGDGGPSVTASLQFSTDAAFTNPVTDPIDTSEGARPGMTKGQNQILVTYGDTGEILKGYDGEPRSIPGDPSEILGFAGRVLNPTSSIGPSATAYRFARIALVNTVPGSSMTLFGHAFVGPKRLASVE